MRVKVLPPHIYMCVPDLYRLHVYVPSDWHERHNTQATAQYPQSRNTFTMLTASPAPLRCSHRLRSMRQQLLPCISRGSLMPDGPPASYDFRAEVAENTKTVVGCMYPQLQDLVDDGECIDL